MRTEPESRQVWIPVAALVAIVACVVTYLACRICADPSVFSYTLDDPLIHLRLAQQIASGHYGINPTEFSSPSSSILWPFLLAPMASSAIALYAPLALNLACLAGLLAVGFATFGTGWKGTLKVALLLVLTNAIGLVFTGMEHTLQLVLSVACASGAILEHRTGKVPRWLWTAMVLGPLIRYENFCITVPLGIYLLIRGHRRAASIAVGLPILLALGFSIFLHSLGLPLLPNSVIAKSGSLGSPLQMLIRAPIENLKAAWIGFLFELGLVLVVLSEAWSLGWMCLGILWLHLTFGKYGWFDRYECYLNGFLLTMALETGLELLKPSPGRVLGKFGVAASTLFGLFVSITYVHRAMAVPKDAHNIAVQQRQMQLFAIKYWNAPVAVNDLGWVSWQNPAYVLDLWGLGSSEALKMRTHPTGGEWMDRLCRKKHVRLCMIYRNWFAEIPPEWKRVGVLIRGRGGAMNEVTFFVTDESDVLTADAALIRFCQHLPLDATWNFDYGAVRNQHDMQILKNLSLQEHEEKPGQLPAHALLN